MAKNMHNLLVDYQDVFRDNPKLAGDIQEYADEMRKQGYDRALQSILIDYSADFTTNMKWDTRRFVEELQVRSAANRL